MNIIRNPKFRLTVILVVLSIYLSMGKFDSFAQAYTFPESLNGTLGIDMFQSYLPRVILEDLSRSTPLPAVIVTFTTPIRAGSNEILVLKTVPGVSCFVSYTTPLNITSTAAGLGSTTADVNGLCSWEWNVGMDTGTGYVTIRFGQQIVIRRIMIQP